MNDYTQSKYTPQERKTHTKKTNKSLWTQGIATCAQIPMNRHTLETDKYKKSERNSETKNDNLNIQEMHSLSSLLPTYLILRFITFLHS